jgi:hypothetical protein
MEQIHILNGDALREKLQPMKLPGRYVVCRECLIDGPVRAEINESFWTLRANFIARAFHESQHDYHEVVRREFEKLQTGDQDEIYLWFENDLFCQVNYWFCIAYLSTQNKSTQIYRVFPSAENYSPGWTGFGWLTSDDLLHSWDERKKLAKRDIEMGTQLWSAYASGNTTLLKQLSSYSSEAFQLLPEVVRAHVERLHSADKLTRPQQTLFEIVKHGRRTFPEIFQEFCRREGVYGFGDLQVKTMLDELNIDYSGEG